MSNREEFVKWFESRYIDDIHPDSTIGIASWETWQARVPEGYVVVPKEPTKNMLNSGYRVKHDKIIDLGNVYKAMLEAVGK